jgi:hypothetical protein
MPDCGFANDPAASALSARTTPEDSAISGIREARRYLSGDKPIFIKKGALSPFHKKERRLSAP